MVIRPRIRGGICTTAHPQGCARHVEEQVEFIRGLSTFPGPRNALIIGSSTGYGLASRITAAYGSGAKTLGVFFERPAEGNRTASAGWYNTAAFERSARRDGFYARHINGDAFSDEVKRDAIDIIRHDLGSIDLLIYSLASPRRTHPKTGQVFKSALKPIGRPYTTKSVDAESGSVTQVTMEPATDEEISDTVAVMGGDDWSMWIDALESEHLLSEDVRTVAYSYIGPGLTHAIYRSGTIGKAKEHLESTARELDRRLSVRNGRALVSVNKAVVTQSSAAIPAVPLYIALLFGVMKKKTLHEDCIQQCRRLFADRLYGGAEVPVDEEGRIRLDDREMLGEVQAEVARLWEIVTTENLGEISDIAGYRADFQKLFGFGLAGVDESADVNPDVPLVP